MKTKGGRVFTGHALHDKQKRSLAILDLIRKKGVMSRTDISRSTGINVVSISHYINNFIDENILLEKGLAASSGGRKPELLELNSKGHYCVGLDISSGGFSVALTDIAARVIYSKKHAASDKGRAVAEAAVGFIKGAIAASGVPADKVRAIGLCARSDSVEGLGDMIERDLGIETFLGGEAACAAFAERIFNKDADAERILYMYSDLGRGVIIDGGDCLGCVGVYGEMTSVPDEKEPGGSSGASEGIKYLRPWGECLGSVAMARKEVSRGVGTRIVSLSGGDESSITEDIIIEAARQKDETALNIIQSISITLGLRIAYLANLFEPRVVIIGGGPERAQEITFPLVRKMVDRLSLKRLRPSINIIPASTPDDSLCMGAAALAVREVFLRS